MKVESLTPYQDRVTISGGEWRIWTAEGARLSAGKGYKAGDIVPGSWRLHGKRYSRGRGWYYPKFV